MKVALVYDRVNKFGGAERVLQILYEMFPKAPLYTSVYNRETTPWADDFEIKTTFLQQLPFAKENHEYIAPLIPIAFESFDFDGYDIVISVTSEYAKGIITKPHTLHICYCLTPTRYLWSGYETYFRGLTPKILAKPFISYLRTWDNIAAQRPDYYIAISKTVQDRIKEYYQIEAEIIYPPVALSNSKLVISNFEKTKAKKNPNYQLPVTNYFLIVSRLVPYKRVDIAIEACNKLGLPLKIVGTGRESNKLKSLAGSNVEFLGNLTDTALSRYYEDCTALIFPGEEDFGLVILEAQSFGKPVIAFGRGAALETIVEGKTGIFFYSQTTQALSTVLKKFNIDDFDAGECIKQVAKFGKERFKKDLINMIDRTYKKHRKTI